jgi:hypothetical protein
MPDRVQRSRSGTPPFHERIRIVGWFRERLRRTFFHFFAKLMQTEDARRTLTSSLEGSFCGRNVVLQFEALSATPPYTGLGKARSDGGTSQRDDVIFITARFRSGSTLVWNLFRNLRGFTSYYEPFNERRWFNPHKRGSRIDPTHRRAEEYWREYEGLGDLDQYYQESWIDHHLYMDARSWNPGMKRYIELLIEHAPGRPVLQFNRIDFRLLWFRHHFSRAKIIHLFRHPREQWCSSLVNAAAFPREKTMKDFAAHDHFYLRAWARDLRYQFPFLDEACISHPYQMFYLIWKLSFAFGRSFAHHSLAYEHLVSDPEACLLELFSKLGVNPENLVDLKALIEKPPVEKWRAYADEAWFQAQEASCEEILERFFR